MIMLACVTFFSFSVSVTIRCSKKKHQKGHIFKLFHIFLLLYTKCTMFTMSRLLLEAGADVLLADNQGTD
jgi:hypothetical protein